MEPVFCQTRRLMIRKIQESDFDDFCTFLIDPETCYLMGRDIITDRASARPTFDWLKDHEPRGYALILRQTGHAIGNLTVSAPHHLASLPAVQGKRGVSMSFSLERGFRRQGLMREALEAAIQQVFEIEHMDYVNCGNFDYNLPSAALQKKLGFAHLHTEVVDVEDQRFVCVENILWNTGKKVRP